MSKKKKCITYLLTLSYFFCSNTSCTLPFEMRKNIDQMALSPNGTLLVTVDKGKNVIDLGLKI